MVDFGPDKADLGPLKANFGPERAISGPGRADFRSGLSFWLGRPDFGPERSDGGTKGRNDKQTDGWTNKSPPVFYRASSPSGPLPKKKLVSSP